MKKLMKILIVVQIINILVFTAGSYMFFAMKANETFALQAGGSILHQQAKWPPHNITDTKSGFGAISDDLLDGVNELHNLNNTLQKISSALEKSNNNLEKIHNAIRNSN